jgi:hypothetical protein
MQRKWASMWLMSQEHSLWPERPATPRETPPQTGKGSPAIHINEEPQETDPRSEAERMPWVRSNGDSSDESFLADPLESPVASKTETTAPSEAAIVPEQIVPQQIAPQQIHQQQSRQQPFRGPSVGPTSVDKKAARKNKTLRSKSTAGSNGAGELGKDEPAAEQSDLAAPTFSLHASHDSLPVDAPMHEGSATGTVLNKVTFGETEFAGTKFAEPRFDRTMVDQTMVGRTISDQAIIDQTITDQLIIGQTSVDQTIVDSAEENAEMMDARMFDSSSTYPSSDRASSDISSSDLQSTSPSWRQRLADLRVTLRFHRANLYLGAAIFLAALVLLWPTVSAPQKAELSPVERALVFIGIAEAPAPVIHSTGDPGINVWVDPHTALYYCPGEEQYGNTPDGRVSSQHDAQMDRFQPAGRSPCE